mgnify:CR=1 FL=1
MLDIYIREIEALKLIVHQPKDISSYSRIFWSNKSKAPYQWGFPDEHPDSKVPWLSFVGYQVNRKGEVRVRKSSIKKELDKQKREAVRIRRLLQINTTGKATNFVTKNKAQILFRLKQRFVAMSIGKVQLHKYKTTNLEMCWANGFLALTDNPHVRYQLKRLDKGRDRQLKLLARFIPDDESVKTQTPEWGIVSKGKTKGKSKRLPKIHYGSPFSYFGSLFRSGKKTSNTPRR